ncbi:neural cell adhesion molecule 2-like [Antedon mediterranea]|uniref:neural cell adhesion molecule 2-like n=1 Tax=Antedon mediterranea TaxID=105859 RepID=UPI003AF57A1C
MKALISCILFFIYSTSFTSAVQLIQGPISQKVRRGNTATLECSVTSIQTGESVVWKHVEHLGEKYVSVNHLLYVTDPELRRRYKVTWNNKKRDFHLQITDAQDIDGGLYECGYIDSRQTFMKLAQATLTLEVPMEGAPTCDVSPTKPKIGDTITLTCSAATASGLMPTPTLLWDINGREVLNQAGTTTLAYYQILQRADEGAIFRCKAISNAFAHEPFCTIIPLPRSPVATVRADKAFYKVGDNATFVCSEISGENVKYSWSKVDVDIMMTGRFELKANNRVLTITNLKQSDNNSVIECEVETPDGRLSKGAAMSIKIGTDTATTSWTAAPTMQSPLVDKSTLHPVVIVVFVLLVVAIVVILALVLIRYSRKKARRSHSKI